MPQTPPITESMREYAREHPDSWLYLVDPAYDTATDPPAEAVIGAYRIHPDGTLDPDFQANEQYQPSELAASPLVPSNELEQVLLDVASGQATESDLPPAVLAGEILLYATHAADSTIYTAEMSDGAHLVPACTSAARVPTGWPSYRTVPGSAIPALLDGRDLGLNLDDAVQAVIPHQLLNRSVES